MTEKKKIIIAVLSKHMTIKTWIKTDAGKQLIFPELLIGCEELLYSDLDKVFCMKVITHESRNLEPVDFVVRKRGVRKTLSKILEWALEIEDYDMATRVRNLVDVLNTKHEKERNPSGKV
jgi:hypothetical protein